MVSPDRRREAVAQVQVGDEVLAARREEAALAQPPLEPLEGALRLVDLDRVASRPSRATALDSADRGRPLVPVSRALDTTVITLPSV